MSYPDEPHRTPTSYGPPGSTPTGPPPTGYGGHGYGGPGWEPPRRSRLPLVVGGVVLALVLVVGGVVAAVALLGGDEEPADERRTSRTEEPSEPSTDEPSEPTEPTEPTEDVPPASDPDVAALSGFWIGTYTCAQGPTPLTLTIAPGDDGAGVRAIFDFGVEGNSVTPRGQFLMEGSLVDGYLELNATEWQQRPPNYTSVDLVAEVPDSSTDAITGTVVDPNCETFAISRR